MTQPALDFTAPVTPYQQHAAEERQEAHRRASAKARVLARLQQGPATNEELNAICYRYGARLLELRRAGWPIDTEPLCAGVFVYRLRQEAR